MTLIKSQKKDIYCELTHQNVTIETCIDNVPNGNGPNSDIKSKYCSISRCPKKRQCPYLR